MLFIITQNHENKRFDFQQIERKKYQFKIVLHNLCNKNHIES